MPPLCHKCLLPNRAQYNRLLRAAFKLAILAGNFALPWLYLLEIEGNSLAETLTVIPKFALKY